MGYKAAVQVLKSAEELKTKLTKKYDLLNDDEAWSDQQQLQTIYHQVLVLDLEYALDKKVEQELWTLGFKNHISALQELTRDKKNPRRSESQALLAWCLESASGFYLTLLQELCTTFDLDLPFRRKGTTYGQLRCPNTPEQITVPQSSSCLYICQYCLVHLGDIARYRNQRKQAESFYKQAIIVSPTSGHPYNQLGLLEASQGDKLSTVFQYVRGIAVKNPFPATATNLSNTLSSIIDKDEPLTEVQTKMVVSEFMKLFLRAHGLLHSLTNLNEVELIVKSLNSTLTALIATQGFTTDKLIKITAINMFAIRHITGPNVLNISELTTEELKARELILDLLAGSLSAFLLPVYTLKADETILTYYALPAIKLILYWIEKEPKILEENVFASRLQIWPGFSKLLNSIQPHLTTIDSGKYSSLPLTEDRELQGFLPLADKFKDFDFKIQFEDITEKEPALRCARIVQFGKWLTTFAVNDTKLIIEKKDDSNENLVVYEPGCIQPDPTDQLLEEMKSINISEKLFKPKEKRGGILKPQGSLEKSREEREIQCNSSDPMTTFNLSPSTSSGNISTSYNSKLEATRLKRAKQNVAMQSIYKKMEENKQVKFSTETADNEKEKTLKSKHPVKLPNATHISQQFRSPAFNPTGLQFPSSDISKDFFNSSQPPLHSRQGDNRTMAANMMFSKNGLDPMPKGPFGMQNAQPPQPMFNSNQGQMPQGTVFNMPPPPMNPFQLPVNANLNFQKQQVTPPAPQATPQMPFNNQQMGQPPQGNTGNWWPQNQQMPAPQQPPNFNFQPNFPAGNNGMSTNMNPYPPPGVTVDYSKANVYSNPWPNNMQTPNQGMMGGGFNNAGTNMSMRQAMLNESKNNTGSNMQPMINMNMPSEKVQHPQSAPGYSLFNSSSWTPNLSGQIRTQQNDNFLNNIQPQSLFSFNTPSLKQLLEQQNQMRKDK